MSAGCSWQAGQRQTTHPLKSHHKPGEDENVDDYHIHCDEDGDDDGGGGDRLHHAASLGIACCPFLLEIPGSPLFRPKIGEIAVETLPRKSVKKFCATGFYSANGETCFGANKWPGEGSSQIQYQILS